MGLATGQQQQISRLKQGGGPVWQGDPDLSSHQQVKRHYPGRALRVGEGEAAAIEAAHIEGAADPGLADQLIYGVHDSIWYLFAIFKY
ncbi:hypothetical protein D3C79_743690 [compost metagenome]